MHVVMSATEHVSTWQKSMLHVAAAILAGQLAAVNILQQSYAANKPRDNAMQTCTAIVLMHKHASWAQMQFFPRNHSFAMIRQ